MSPNFLGIRFVLNWTNDPPDLDLLLHLPPSVPVAYPWIDYLEVNKGSATQPPFAIRDADMSSGWGPETITIHRTYPGTYSLYARKYPGYGGNTLAQSGAQLVAYLGQDVIPGNSPQLRPLASLNVPKVGTEDWWYLCDVDGLTTNITWVNKFITADPRGATNSATSSGPFTVGSRFPNSRTKDGAPTTVDYTWDFGDASPVSHESNPGMPMPTRAGRLSPSASVNGSVRRPSPPG